MNLGLASPIGQGFGSLSLFLWCLAGVLFSVGLLSGYFLLTWLWRLPERMPKIAGSNLLKLGDFELPKEPPKKLTVMQAAKMMVLAGGLLLAYDVGVKREKAVIAAKYAEEHSAWQQRSAEIQRLNAKWKQDYAAWAAKENK